MDSAWRHVCDINEQDRSGPSPYKNLKKKKKTSQCTPLFMNAHTVRGAGAVIHTCSKAAVIVTTILSPGWECENMHQEMIKRIRYCTLGGHYRYDDMLVVPIIEKTPEVFL